VRDRRNWETWLGLFLGRRDGDRSRAFVTATRIVDLFARDP
jgi:hypothetical protein